MELNPEEKRFTSLEYDALLALHRYDELLQRNEAEQKTAPDNFGLTAERIMLLTLQGKAEEAGKEITRFCRRLIGTDMTETKQYLTGILRMSENNLPAYVDATATIPELAFSHNLYKGDLAAAEQALNDSGEDDAYQRLTIYIAGHTITNAPETADRNLQQACALLGRGDSDDRQLLKLLQADEITERDLRELILPTGNKAIAAGALGIRHPALSKTAFDVSRRLYFSPAGATMIVTTLPER